MSTPKPTPVAFALALALTACTTDKAPFDDPALDAELTQDGKADYFTNRTVIRGSLSAGVPVEDRFLAHRYVGYTFAGQQAQVIDLALDATDGYSDPVLLLYGPRKPNGKWPARLALSDDAVGLDSRIAGFALPADGTYLAIAAEYWGDPGSFRLSLDLPALPGIGEGCGADDACADGLTCMTYCGISCAIQFKSCEISCLDTDCPDDLMCITIYDGPGTVCRPVPSEECPVESCGPALGMPNTLCPDGVSVSGPTGRCLRQADAACGWEVLSCPE